MATTVGTIELIAKIDTRDYIEGTKEIDQATENVEGSVSSLSKTNKKTESSFARLTKRGLKVATVGFIGLAGAITAMSLKGGFDRALNIEDAQAKLRGLGHDAESVQTIMDNALASVKGTAFGLDAAATTAANAVASGIRPGLQLEQVLKTVANTAAIAGRDMSDLGAIFNKVAAANKVQMDVINQLHDAGVPALALIAEEIGKTAEETANMASRGEIDFATFERAMRKGVGDAALQMGDTTRGSLANMRAAFSRAGAHIATRILPQLKDAMQGIIVIVDNIAQYIPGAMDSIMEHFTRLKDLISNLGDGFSEGDFKNLGVVVGQAIANGLNAAIAGLSVSMKAIKGWFGKINWGDLGVTVGRQAVAFIVGFLIGLMDFDIEALFRVLADNWQAALIGLLTLVLAPAKLVRPIAMIISKIPFGNLLLRFILRPIRNLFTPIREGFGALFSRIGDWLVAPFRKAGGSITNIFTRMGNFITGVIEDIGIRIVYLPEAVAAIFRAVFKVVTTILQPLTAFFGNLFKAIWKNISGSFSGTGAFFRGVLNSITGVFKNVGSFFSRVFSSAVTGIKNVFGGLVGYFSNIWGRIVNLFGSVGTRIGDVIGRSFKWVINSVIRGAVNIINNFINAINRAIGVINNIPGVNISRLGNLPVPQLASGGIVTEPTLAMIGEGKESEAVLPLSKLDDMLNAEPKESGSNITIHLQGVFATSAAEQRKIAEQIVERIREVEQAKGLRGAF